MELLDVLVRGYGAVCQFILVTSSLADQLCSDGNRYQSQNRL